MFLYRHLLDGLLEPTDVLSELPGPFGHPLTVWPGFFCIYVLLERVCDPQRLAMATVLRLTAPRSDKSSRYRPPAGLRNNLLIRVKLSGLKPIATFS